MRPTRGGWLPGFVVALALAMALPPALGPGHAQTTPTAPTGVFPAESKVVPATVRAAGPYLGYEWGTAQILYGPGDDTTHFMGEGAAMVADDSLRNLTTFGGEGSGGLTNWTVNYN